MMRTDMTALAVVALVSLCAPAVAQAQCPQLTQLRSEAQEALRQTRTVTAPERCYRYNRLSEAWGEVARYANDNRESCHVSPASLNEFERYREKAAKDRDNVCAGRLLGRYGADIIQH